MAVASSYGMDRFVRSVPTNPGVDSINRTNPGFIPTPNPVYAPQPSSGGGYLPNNTTQDTSGGGGSYYDPVADAQRQEAARVAAEEAAARADESAYWNDQISGLQRLLGSVGTQRDQGLTRLTDTFNRAKSGIDADEQRAMRNYGNKRTETFGARESNLIQNDNFANNTFNSLQRILGAAGAGVSSAARELAPYLVSKNATSRRTGIMNTAGRNLRDIDLAEGDAKSQFAMSRDDLSFQKNTQEEDFLRGISQSEIDLNERLADAATKKAMAEGGDYRSAQAARSGFTNVISDRQNQLDSLFNRYRNPSLSAKAVQVQNPELAQYTVDKQRINVNNGGPIETGAYLPFLNKRKEEGFI